MRTDWNPSTSRRESQRLAAYWYSTAPGLSPHFRGKRTSVQERQQIWPWKLKKPVLKAPKEGKMFFFLCYENLSTWKMAHKFCSWVGKKENSVSANPWGNRHRIFFFYAFHVSLKVFHGLSYVTLFPKQKFSKPYSLKLWTHLHVDWYKSQLNPWTTSCRMVIIYGGWSLCFSYLASCESTASKKQTWKHKVFIDRYHNTFFSFSREIQFEICLKR